MEKKRYKEDELIACLKSGDAKQFEVIYDHFSSALYGIIYKILDNEEQAQQVLQDVFFKIWNQSATYDQQRCRLFTWMLTIARGVSLNHLAALPIKKEKQNQSVYANIMSSTTNATQPYNAIVLKKVLNPLNGEHKRIIDLTMQ